jgi:predicted PurR-regulated permease PerM
MPRTKTKVRETIEATPEATLQPKDKASAPLPLHSQGRRIARMCFALALVALALWIARDFLAPLAWAVILAIAIWPLYARLADVTAMQPPPVIAPLLMTILIGVMLLAPLVLATQEIADRTLGATLPNAYQCSPGR